MTQSVLVTGARGFIGHHVCDALFSRGFTVVGVDDRSTGQRTPSNPEIEIIDCDLRDAVYDPTLLPICPDYVVHCAAQSSGEKSFDDPLNDFSRNVLATFELLRWSLDVGCRHFVFLSSMSVYGNPGVSPVTELQPTAPRSYYAAGKLAGESYVKLFAELGLNVTTFRLFNVYGPGQDLLELRQGMLSIYLAQALMNFEVRVRGSLDRVRDFVYIDDVVRAVCLAIGNPDRTQGLFNVCSGTSTSVEQLLNRILAHTDLTWSAVSIEEGTPGDQVGFAGDRSLIRSVLGWEPTVDLSEGLARTVEYARSTLL